MRQSGPLVLVNVLNYGHFNSYAGTIARWALGSGLDVLLVGHGAEAAGLGMGLAGRGDFATAEIGRFCPGIDWADPEQAKAALGKGCREIVAAIARAHAPFAVLLINADEVFFHNPEAEEPHFAFAAPTYGVVTFGRREAHLGMADLYARRLNATVRRGSGFAGLLSIDELHVRDHDPDERFLHYLPDPYKEFHAPAGAPAPGLQTGAEAGAGAEALRAFLAAAPGPVAPILGKFDRRKGNLWLLRAALKLPALRVVVLGQRVADPAEDAEIDSCLAELAGQGRAFVRFGFLPQELFDLTLASGKAPCLPLPYRFHTGSSGLQLMAHEHGVPVLAPDFGLMAERIQAHGLGEVYRPYDEADFAARYAALLERGPGPYRADIRRFMDCFGPGATGGALADMLLEGKPRSGNLQRILGLRRVLPAPLQAADEARRALAFGHWEAAVQALDRALAATPDSPGLLLVRGVALWRLGRVGQSARDLLRCAAFGLDEELRFFALQAMLFVYEDFLSQTPPRSAALAEALFAVLPGVAQELGGRAGPNGVTGLTPEFWQQLGGISAQSVEHARGAACFRMALALDPANAEYHLNLSDVLRYAGRLDEALEPLAALERLDPAAHGLAHKRGQVLLAQGRAKEAAAQFALEPRNSPHRQAAQAQLDALGAKAPSS